MTDVVIGSGVWVCVKSLIAGVLFSHAFSGDEALVGSEKRVAMVAADLVRHFEDRVAAMDGKAMVVCMSRRICVALYNQIVALRPEWHTDDDAAGLIKVVMTG